MKNNNDELYTCFENLLLCPNACEQETGEALIHRVVESYLMCLLDLGHIPTPHLEDLRDDLTAEVVDMFRTKTYGFLTLGEFRKAHRGSKSQRAS